jgi:hypothetical protein
MANYIFKKPTSYILQLKVPQINLDVRYNNKTICKAHDNKIPWIIYRQDTVFEVTYWAGTSQAKCRLLCT